MTTAKQPPSVHSWYGWRPEPPQLKDGRDWQYAPSPATLKALPAKVDLTPQCPPVLDQGALGSCTANAIASAFRFDLMKQGVRPFAPSRLFVYYNERALEGTTRSDSGAYIRDGFKSISSQGVCPEDGGVLGSWPYAVGRFAAKPPASCYKEALRHRSLTYLSVLQQAPQMKGTLAEGYPFVVGFTVYESFESATVTKTGVVPMPSPGEQILGGHAVLCVGFDDTLQRWRCMNSWGLGWGKPAGFFTLPYAYLTAPSLSGDFWVVKAVSS